MSVIEDAPRRDLSDLVKAVIGEAWRRARRRRLAYAGVLLFLAVIGAIGFSTLKGPSTSVSGSPAVLAGPTTPVARVLAGEHIYHGEFDLDSKRGSLYLSLRFGSQSGNRTWQVGTPVIFSGSGDYFRVSGQGYGFQAGGHADAWYASITGVIRHPEKGKQRVVITLKGRPDGTFILTPKQSGFLKRDRGTQSSGWMG